MNSFQTVSAVLLLGVGANAHASTTEPVPLRRAAIIVGANAAATGRKPLRFAHRDATEVAAVLNSVGGFSPEETHLLLDPTPKHLLSVVDRELARLSEQEGPTMLVFYYSGHADERSLFPSGQPLLFDAIRKRLDTSSVGVRIGIIDTCRGGGWTGTRGLEDAEPFEVQLPFDLSSEGSVLIASSSGLENAHESEILRGGFFTHHWNAALRGAGDRNGDGEVTLTEAYDYAKQLTIRDTALRTATPQHPSFRMNLRGRRDLALTRLAANPTVLNVQQDRGPMQLVHLDTGLIVLELPEGERSVGLAVAPGRYVVRAGSGRETRAEEVTVMADKTTAVREGDLQLVGHDGIVMRSFKPRPSIVSTVPDGKWDLRHFLGTRRIDAADNGFSIGPETDIALGLVLVHGLSDRLSLNVLSPALAYRGGNRGDFEWITSAGLSSWGVGWSSVEGARIDATLRADLDLRWWFSSRSSIQAGVTFASSFRWINDPLDPRLATGPDSWRGGFDLGYTHTLGGVVTLSIGVAYQQNLIVNGAWPTDVQGRAISLSFGSVQSLGFRNPPLVQVHLSDAWALDAYATLTYNSELAYFSGSSGLEETYALGFTRRLLAVDRPTDDRRYASTFRHRRCLHLRAVCWFMP